MIHILKKGSDFSEVDYEAGVAILVNKPLGWTSFDVVNKIRHRLRHKYEKKKFKVGHNGTLDPLATGLLMIFTGKYTKRIPLEENHDKRYTGTVKLGATTASLDREMEEVDVVDSLTVTKEQVLQGMSTFHGEMTQEIPIYSAAKINGTAMYKLARKDKKFKPKSKQVFFHEVTMTDCDLPYVNFDILCGKGTYIRAFARDLGAVLSTPAYLYALRRTGIASYDVNEALEVDEICQAINPES
jgi:tRNA pseudouridine55 synthase